MNQSDGMVGIHLRNVYEENPSANCVLAGVVGGVFSILSLYVSFGLNVNDGYFQTHTTLGYILAIGVFVAASLATYLILAATKFGKTRIEVPAGVSIAVMGLLFFTTFVLFYSLLINDDGYNGADVSKFWWHLISPKVVTLGVTISTILFIYILSQFAVTQLRLPMWWKVTYTVFLAIVYACTTVYFNIFAGDIYHIDAFLHPIYNVFYNTPYSEVSYGIYGHYELLYRIPMYFFGSNPLVICVTHWIVAFCTFMLCAYVIGKVTTSEVIWAVGSFAVLVPTACMFQSSSYQTTPHRVFFSVLLIAYAIKALPRFDSQEFPWRCFWIGHIICGFSLLCSLESGVLCCVAWTFFIFQNRLAYRGLLRAIKSLAASIVACVADLVFGDVQFLSQIEGGVAESGAR